MEPQEPAQAGICSLHPEEGVSAPALQNAQLPAPRAGGHALVSIFREKKQKTGVSQKSRC